ncbi:MAG TPA: sigma-70 family RNA polymerase sigma factor [Vicinamibacterales bacterium]|jgi:RNA polymerase sigma-70 factor (ECF subfamily)|nr:sigma-70 family RNA polymerase sigma factor [Vicinamibacterales bacterium]
MHAVPQPVAPDVAEELERVYREHAPLIYRTAWGVLGTREDAEDVVQSVFLGLMRRQSLPDFQQNPRAYFYKAAVTASLDILKAKRRRPILVDDVALFETAAPDSSSTFDEELYERLYAAIARLTPDACSVLLLRYMHNKSLAEIARELGVSRAVVAVRLFRSRARLKALFRDTPENSHATR